MKESPCLWCKNKAAEVFTDGTQRVICADCHRKYWALRAQGYSDAAITKKRKWECRPTVQLKLPL